MQPATHIVDDCIALLKQAANLVELVSDDVFATTTPISPRGSIGGHLRHVLDFYRNFLCGLEDDRVDYNRRERDALTERERWYALGRIRETIDDLMRLRDLDIQAHLLVSTECGDSWSRSSVQRELDFLLSHTIHHYSSLAMILRLHEIEPGEEFGVAPSTLKHWRQEAVCAQ